MMFRTLARTAGAAAALVCFAAADASAITQYRTTIDFVPAESRTGGLSLDPADGNRIVVDWSTALTTGRVEGQDVVNATFRLFGEGVLLFEDEALIGGVLQPIGGVTRVTLDSDFWEFDLDDWLLDPSDGLITYDNDIDVVQENGGVGETYNIYRAQNLFYVDGVQTDSGFTRYNFNAPTTVVFTEVVAPVPLPAGLPLLAAALGALAVVRRRAK